MSNVGGARFCLLVLCERGFIHDGDEDGFHIGVRKRCIFSVYGCTLALNPKMGLGFRALGFRSS